MQTSVDLHYCVYVIFEEPKRGETRLTDHDFRKWVSFSSGLSRDYLEKIEKTEPHLNGVEIYFRKGTNCYSAIQQMVIRQIEDRRRRTKRYGRWITDFRCRFGKLQLLKFVPMHRYYLDTNNIREELKRHHVVFKVYAEDYNRVLTGNMLAIVLKKWDRSEVDLSPKIKCQEVLTENLNIFDNRLDLNDMKRIWGRYLQLDENARCLYEPKSNYHNQI